MQSSFMKNATAYFAAAFATLGATLATAETVKLTTLDGRLTVEGELLQYENSTFVVSTALGSMQIAADMVTCEGGGCPVVPVLGGDIFVAGSDTIGASLMPQLVYNFAAIQGAAAEVIDAAEGIDGIALTGNDGFGDPIGTFNISSTGSSDAFDALLDTTTQIGMSSRRVLPAEARLLRISGAGNVIDRNQEHVIAVDSISVIVHPDNPMNSITLADLDLIFSGRVANWSQIGGPDAPIVTHSRDAGSGTAAVFANRVFARSGRSFANTITTQASNEELASAVRDDINAIGFVGSASTRGTKAISLVDTCGLTSAPTTFGSKTEEYPLQRRLYLYNREDNVTPTTRAFLDYALSSASDDAISKVGFVNLAIDRIHQDQASGRIQAILEDASDVSQFRLAREMLLDMFKWDRLSTTFRFASGSAQLDGKGVSDLARLVTYLSQQPNGTEVSLVGFTDGDGAFGANQSLSVGRAQRVADELLAAGGSNISNVNVLVKGFGELSPTACNDSLDGKRVNRRVEVWVRQAS